MVEEGREDYGSLSKGEMNKEEQKREEKEEGQYNTEKKNTKIWMRRLQMKLSYTLSSFLENWKNYLSSIP